jgi:hypothetical protein
MLNSSPTHFVRGARESDKESHGIETGPHFSSKAKWTETLSVVFLLCGGSNNFELKCPAWILNG